MLTATFVLVLVIIAYIAYEVIRDMQGKKCAGIRGRLFGHKYSFKRTFKYTTKACLRCGKVRGS